MLLGDELLELGMRVVSTTTLALYLAENICQSEIQRLSKDCLSFSTDSLSYELGLTDPAHLCSKLQVCLCFGIQPDALHDEKHCITFHNNRDTLLCSRPVSPP